MDLFELSNLCVGIEMLTKHFWEASDKTGWVSADKMLRCKNCGMLAICWYKGSDGVIAIRLIHEKDDEYFTRSGIEPVLETCEEEAAYKIMTE